MTRMTWPNLIFLHRLNRKDKLVWISVLDIEMHMEIEEKRIRSNEIILITLMTIFILLFFARSLTTFLVLLTSGLIVGIFGWIKLYKENGQI